MPFTGIESYLAHLSPDLVINISEFAIEFGKTRDPYVTLSIKEWFLFSNFISKLDAKAKCFALLFADKSGDDTYLYEKFLSSKISAGVTIREKKIVVFLRVHDVKAECSCYDETTTVYLNEDDFQALMWYQIDINSFIEAMPAAHQENKVHKSGDKKYSGCKLCFEVFRRMLDPTAIEERLRAKARREARKLIFSPDLQYIDYIDDMGEQKKKAIIVNAVQGETTEL